MFGTCKKKTTEERIDDMELRDYKDRVSKYGLSIYNSTINGYSVYFANGMGGMDIFNTSNIQELGSFVDVIERYELYKRFNKALKTPKKKK